MMQIIATDVPVWLKNIITNVKWNKIGFLDKALLEGAVRLKCSSLPQKSGDSYCKNIDTDAPTGVLDSINRVDFSRLSADYLKQFQAEIQTSAKPYL